MKSGRTHMQDAVPIRLGQEFAAYGVAIAEAKARSAAGQPTLCANLASVAARSAPASTRIRDYRAAGHREPGAHLRRRAHAGRGHALGHAIECAAWRRSAPRCAVLALEVIRISNDLRLLCPVRTPASRRSTCPACSPDRPSCPARSTPSCPSWPPWSASRSSATTPRSLWPCRPASWS